MQGSWRRALRCGRPAGAGLTRLTRCSAQYNSAQEGGEEVGGKKGRQPQTAWLQ